MHNLWWLQYLDYILVVVAVVGVMIVSTGLHAIIQLWKHFTKEK